MGGVDAVRGIGYQHAQAVLAALDLLADEQAVAIMVEGTDDVIDIAILDAEGRTVRAKQIKTRDQAYTWGKSELRDVLRRWASAPASTNASFEFVTDGRLGPTGLEVKSALESAAAGDLEPAVTLFETSIGDPVCEVLRSCCIRQDQIGVEPILAEAEREVRTLQVSSAADADLRAQQAVDRLFREISIRAGLPTAAERTIEREEVRQIIDGIAAVPPSDRWTPSLSDEYLAAVQGLAAEQLVEPTLSALGAPGVEGIDVSTDLGQYPIDSLVGASKYTTLTGVTGSGKSTVTRLLREQLAKQDAVVVVTHAEAYLAGRLDSLVADGLSAVIGRQLPTPTGRQALEDPAVTVVIDGVSEIASEVRTELAKETRSRSVGGHGARLVLVGRDAVAVGTALSPLASWSRYSVAAFQDAQQTTLATDVLADSGLDPEHGVAMAKHALGDASGNPMLLTMALQLIAAGTDFQDRAGLYEGVIGQMATRTGVDDIDIVRAALGIAYAGLIDEGRRYASVYEWQRRITVACRQLVDLGVDAERTVVLEAADACGLVTRIGHTQVRVPVHDSFADYLAGWAHSESLADFPEALTADDTQRVLFAGEIGGVSASIAAAAAEQLPFACLRLARSDSSPCADDAPATVASLLHLLAPMSAPVGVCMWRDSNRIVASMVAGQPSVWVERTEGQALIRSWPSCIVEAPNGPLAIAVRLWSIYVREQLKDSTPPTHRTLPTSLESAAGAVALHAEAEQDELDELLARSFSDIGAEAVRGWLEPLGIRAIVFPSGGPPEFGAFSIIQQKSPEISVRAATEEEINQITKGETPSFVAGPHGRGGLDWHLRDTPRAAAAQQIRSAANDLASTTWL